MAAPTPTARTTPAGTKLDDPFPTTLAFSLLPGVGLWEKEVTPPGIDGREPIDIATMFNTTVVTKAPRVLREITNSKGKYQYDPASLSAIMGLINVKGSITVWFATGQSWCFYGYLQKFIPTTNSDSTEPPMADAEIVATCYDPVEKVEALPVYTASSGTGSIT